MINVINEKIKKNAKINMINEKIKKNQWLMWLTKKLKKIHKDIFLFLTGWQFYSLVFVIKNIFNNVKYYLNLFNFF